MGVPLNDLAADSQADAGSLTVAKVAAYVAGQATGRVASIAQKAHSGIAPRKFAAEINQLLTGWLLR
jgi:hypothetical protein